MIVEIKKHQKTSVNEVFIGGFLVGVFEKMNPDSGLFSFMSKCSHDRLTGDHYILIGQKLNEVNSVAR